MKKVLGSLLILAVMLTPALAFAASPWTEKATYSERVGAKLEFGVKNTLLGWVDLFYEPNKAITDKGNVWGGLGKGIVDSLINTAGGAVHAVTFLIPVDLPLPDNGVDLGESGGGSA